MKLIMNKGLVLLSLSNMWIGGLVLIASGKQFYQVDKKRIDSCVKVSAEQNS
jgi:hypothetical protein